MERKTSKVESKVESEDGVVHAGFVQTQGKLGIVKHRRFLALDEGKDSLRLCRHEDDVNSRRSLPVSEIARITLSGPRFTMHFEASATPPNNGRDVSVLCSSPEEASDWVKAIESVREHAGDPIDVEVLEDHLDEDDEDHAAAMDDIEEIDLRSEMISAAESDSDDEKLPVVDPYDVFEPRDDIEQAGRSSKHSSKHSSKRSSKRLSTKSSKHSSMRSSMRASMRSSKSSSKRSSNPSVTNLSRGVEEDNDFTVADLRYFEFIDGDILSYENLRSIWAGIDGKPKGRLSKIRESLRKSLSRVSLSKHASRKKSIAKRPSMMGTQEEHDAVNDHVDEDHDGDLAISDLEDDRIEDHHDANDGSNINKTKSIEEEEDSYRYEQSVASLRSSKSRDPEREALNSMIAENLAKKSHKKPPKYVHKQASSHLKPAGGRGVLSFGRGLIKGCAKKKSHEEEHEDPENPDNENQGTTKPLTKEELKEKVARQARQAGGGIYLTGAATVGLVDDFQKSKLAVSLQKRSEENERRKAKEAAEAAKQEAKDAKAARKKSKASVVEPPGKNKFASFLASNPGHAADE